MLADIEDFELFTSRKFMFLFMILMNHVFTTQIMYDDFTVFVYYN